MRIRALTLPLALLLGCASEDLVSANGPPNRTLALALGHELGLTLQSIGPGEYASPPTISSAAVQFIDVVPVMPAVPAGITQRFRFRAAAPGQAVITFQHTGLSATVEDTVNVR